MLTLYLLVFSIQFSASKTGVFKLEDRSEGGISRRLVVLDTILLRLLRQFAIARVFRCRNGKRLGISFTYALLKGFCDSWSYKKLGALTFYLKFALGCKSQISWKQNLDSINYETDTLPIDLTFHNHFFGAN